MSTYQSGPQHGQQPPYGGTTYGAGQPGAGQQGGAQHTATAYNGGPQYPAGPQHPAGPQYPAGPQAGGTPSGPLTRPVTLVIAAGTSALVGLFNIIAGLLIMTASEADLRQAIVLQRAKAAGVSPDVAAELAKSDLTGIKEVDTALQAVNITGISLAVSGLIIAVFALLAFRGATWARVVTLVFLVGALCGNGAAIFVAVAFLPGVPTVLIGAAPALALVGIIMLFLRPNNRYAKALKSRAA